MKQTPLKPISKNRQRIERQEAIKMKSMLKQSNGLCWICRARKATEKSHARDRKTFVPSCRECHSPNGVHKYLDKTLLIEVIPQ